MKLLPNFLDMIIVRKEKESQYLHLSLKLLFDPLPAASPTVVEAFVFSYAYAAAVDSFAAKNCKSWRR